MITKPMLKRKHPNWAEENIDYVLNSPDSWVFVKREALLENPCVKCKKEMGEHAFSVTRGFICP